MYMTLLDILNNKISPNRTAVVFKDRSICYSELFTNSCIFEKEIKRFSPTRHNVAIILPNTPEYIFAYLGIWQSGNVIVPVYYNSSINEIINTINTFDVAVIVTDERVISEIKAKETLLTHKALALDAYSKQKELMASEAPDCPETQAPDDVVIMLGTSGSTSNPKRVMLTEKQLLDNASAIIESLDFGKDEVFLVISSFTFSAANTAQLIVPLLLSAKTVLFDSVVHPAKIVQYIKKYNVTTTAIVPPLLHIWAKYSFDPEDTRTLKMLCISGSIPSPDDVTSLKAKLPYTEISNNYGMTEAGPRISCQRCAEKHPLSVGRPLRNVQVKIIDAFGNEARPGETGQIAVRSPSLMRGYYANPDETARTVKDGWLMTGDSGFIGEEESIIINGRMKNIIITNGINVYPEEIEEVLLSNPHVKEAMVKGEENQIYGEVPIAYVAMDGLTTAAELMAYCRQYLPEIKTPKRIIFVKELDKTSSGKIRRR